MFFFAFCGDQIDPLAAAIAPTRSVSHQEVPRPDEPGLLEADPGHGHQNVAQGIEFARDADRA